MPGRMPVVGGRARCRGCRRPARPAWPSAPPARSRRRRPRARRRRRRAAAQRRAAMFTAYERDLTPAEQPGAVRRGPAPATPSGRVADGDPVPAGRPGRRGHLGQRGVDGGRAAALRAPGADQPQRPLDLGGPAGADGVQQVGQHVGGGQRQVDGRPPTGPAGPGARRAATAARPARASSRRCRRRAARPGRRRAASARRAAPARGPSTAILDAAMTAEPSARDRSSDRRRAWRRRTMIGRCPNPPSPKCCAPAGCG